MFRGCFGYCYIYLILLSVFHIQTLSQEQSVPENFFENANLDPVTQKFRELLPERKELADEEIQTIARDLALFTEIPNVNDAIDEVVQILETFENRIEPARRLLQNYPQLRNQEGVAVLLGFKPRSWMAWSDNSTDYAQFCDDIEGIDPNNVTCRIEWSQIHFGFPRLINLLLTYIHQKFCAVPDITIANLPFQRRVTQRFELNADNNAEAVNYKSGILYGYDQPNTYHFANNPNILLTSGQYVRTTSHAFKHDEALNSDEPHASEIFWRVFEGLEQCARRKLNGYDHLLDLADWILNP